MGAALQADAWQRECAIPPQLEYLPENVLDLSYNDPDGGVVVTFYATSESDYGTPEQRAIILNTLSIVRRDLRPLFAELPGGKLQVTFASTVGYAFANAVVLNRHAHDPAYLARLFLHELGHVWDQNLTTQEERTAFQASLPWAEQTTDWRSDHLPHPMRPIEAYANAFMDSAVPCHLLS
jgi:hypothetical protein